MTQLLLEHSWRSHYIIYVSCFWRPNNFFVNSLVDLDIDTPQTLVVVVVVVVVVVDFFVFLVLFCFVFFMRFFAYILYQDIKTEIMFADINLFRARLSHLAQPAGRWLKWVLKRALNFFIPKKINCFHYYSYFGRHWENENDEKVQQSDYQSSLNNHSSVRVS